MRYKIIGGQFPAAICDMQVGQEIICQSGAMIWMDDGIEMKTEAGGVGKAFGRVLTGENLFVNRYVAHSPGEIAFSSSYPGEIIGIDIDAGNSIIAQKGAFLASDPGVNMSVYLQKKLSGGFFGGEGFLMQNITGNGKVLIEVDGSSQIYDLGPGQRKIIDTGYLVCMDSTCTMSIEKVAGGLKGMLFGGEGLFNTVVTGPGRIILQTMPVSKLAGSLWSLMPHGN